MYGYAGQCVAACPLRTYADSNLICQDCPTVFCLTCDSSGACAACSSDSFYDPDDSLCYQTCPAGKYGNQEYGVCIACHSDCLTCAGSTSSDCLSCPPLSYLVYSSCYASCPPHTYSSTCLLCHESCLNCSGPSPYHCLSCPSFMMLHLNYSTCIDQCYDGDVADNALMTCLTCA